MLPTIHHGSMQQQLQCAPRCCAVAGGGGQRGSQSSGMGSTAWCRMAKLVLCRVRAPAALVVLRCPALLRWHSRRKSASMCVSLTTMSWKLGLQHSGRLSAAGLLGCRRPEVGCKGAL